MIFILSHYLLDLSIPRRSKGAGSKQQISCSHVLAELHRINIKISYIANINSLKVSGKERHNAVSVAFLEYHKSPSVFAVGLYLGYPVIASEEGTVKQLCVAGNKQIAFLSVLKRRIVIGGL